MIRDQFEFDSPCPKCGTINRLKTETDTVERMMPDYRPALEQFRSLPENWNSYGGVPTTQTACDTILRVAKQIPDGYSADSISPTPLGGVQLEWHKNGLHAKLWVDDRGEVDCYAERDGCEEYWSERQIESFVAYLREHLPIPVEC